MAKRHYLPITADVPGVNDSQRAFIRKVIRTALAAEGVDFPCEVDVLLTDDEAIHQINLDMREVDRATDVLSFPEFDLTPGQLPGPEDADPGTGLVPLGPDDPQRHGPALSAVPPGGGDPSGGGVALGGAAVPALPHCGEGCADRSGAVGRLYPP